MINPFTKSFWLSLKKFSQREFICSEKNPKLIIKHSLFRPQIFVAGFDYSTPYIAKMWNLMFKRLPRHFLPKKILVLGMAGGDTAAVCQRWYPSAKITGIEWDPVMVDLAKKLHICDIHKNTEIILGDAFEVMPKLNDKFDLIIMDLFSVDQPDPRVSSPESVAQMHRLLAPEGFLILNLFKSVGMLEPFRRQFSVFNKSRYQFNSLAILRYFGRGTAGDPLPDGFIVPQQSPVFLTSPLVPDMPWELSGKPGNIGLRWHHGPCWFERYYSDEEPEIDYTVHSRLVIWQPLTRIEPPRGWARFFFCLPPRQHGFAVLDGQQDYWRQWSSHAQRHRRDWLKNQRFEIIEASFDEFCAAYNDSGKLPGFRSAFITQLKSHISRDPENVHLFAVRDQEKNRLVAGLAVQDLPDLSQSEHVIAFYHPDYHKTPVNYGLIEHWHQHGLKKGLKFLHFGLVWTFGDPLDWRGYSKFKRQFNLFLLKYPKTFLRIARKARK